MLHFLFFKMAAFLRLPCGKFFGDRLRGVNSVGGQKLPVIMTIQMIAYFSDYI